MIPYDCRKAGVAVTVIGVLFVINALYASYNGAEKTFNLDKYVNTHWITTVVLLAGIAQLVSSTPNGDFKSSDSLTLTFVCHILSAGICLCSFVADVCNLKIVLLTPEIEKRQKLLIYNSVDSFLCILALTLNLQILHHIHRIHGKSNSQHRCLRILGLGTALAGMSVLRLFLYLLDLYNVSESGVRVLFVNYTLDEPCWLVIGIFVAAVVLMSSNHNPLLQSTSLALCGVSIMPSVFYLWLDYRWFNANQLAQKLSPGENTNMASVVCAVVYIMVLTVTCLYYIAQLELSSSVRLESRLSFIFYAFGVIFLALAGVVISLDVYSVYQRYFYRHFHGTEQKTPFMACLAAIFALASTNPSFIEFALPACLASCLFAINSTIFQLVSYVYLAFNAYFPDYACDLAAAIKGGQCSTVVATQGAEVHFFETLANFCILCLSSVVAVTIVRISRMRPMERLTEPQHVEKAAKLEIRIRRLGVFSALAAGALMISILRFQAHHPLLIIYLVLYHLALAAGLIIIPTYQILAAVGISRMPIAANTILMISIIKCGEIVSQLDYRGTGEVLALQWKLHTFAEAAALITHFATIIFLLEIRNIGKFHVTTMSDMVIAFDNPLRELGDEEAGTGYLQLRTEEQDI